MVLEKQKKVLANKKANPETDYIFTLFISHKNKIH